MHAWLVTWMQWVEELGYAGVALLMAMESSIFPVPSEVVVPPAAILATQEGSGMSMWGVVVAGTVGSYIGSCVMYYMALVWGRPFIITYGRYFFMSESKLEAAERFMRRFSAGGIFFSRFLPVVRHLISIPAGMARMPFFTFSLATISGSAIWCAVLAWFGNKVGRDHPDILSTPEALIHAVKDETWLIVGAAGLLLALYLLARYLMRR